MSETDSAPPPAAPAFARDEAEAPTPDRLGALYLGVLIVYVILLGIGVVAEAFDIQWILNWPIY